MKILLVLVALVSLVGCEKASRFLGGEDSRSDISAADYGPSAFIGAWVGTSNSNFVNISGDGTTIGGFGSLNGQSFSFSGATVSGNSLSGGGVSAAIGVGGMLFTRGSTTVQMDRR